MASWRGRGGGRPGAQPTVSFSGPGRGGGRAGGQPVISSRSSWVGSGGGRSASQPSVGAANPMGARSTASTSAWRSAGDNNNVADPAGNYVFALEIDGIEVAQFLECSGLKTVTDIFELQEGGMNSRVHKLPGQSRWDNLVLRYGVTGDISLMKWRDEVLQDEFGRNSRRNGSIVVKNNQMEVVRRFNFVDAWPVTWEGPSLSSSSAELAIEMVELAHHGIYVS